MTEKVGPLRPTSLTPQPVSPLRGARRVEVEQVPAPEVLFCWHCGSKTGRIIQHALGGYAEAICPEARRRVIAVPERRLAKGDGTHERRTARSPIK